jgi:hypothetical protein
MFAVLYSGFSHMSRDCYPGPCSLSPQRLCHMKDIRTVSSAGSGDKVLINGLVMS